MARPHISERRRLRAEKTTLTQQLAQALDDCETLRQAADQLRAALDRALRENTEHQKHIRHLALENRALRAQRSGKYGVAEHLEPVRLADGAP